MNIDLTPTEWHLMECLWEKSPGTGREDAVLRLRYAQAGESITLILVMSLAVGCTFTGSPGGNHRPARNH